MNSVVLSTSSLAWARSNCPAGLVVIEGRLLTSPDGTVTLGGAGVEGIAGSFRGSRIDAAAGCAAMVDMAALSSVAVMAAASARKPLPRCPQRIPVALSVRPARGWTCRPDRTFDERKPT